MPDEDEIPTYMVTFTVVVDAENQEDAVAEARQSISNPRFEYDKVERLS